MERLVKENIKTFRAARLGFRITSYQEALIRKAAEISGKNMTQFVLNSACEAAESILMDQRIFFANDEMYRSFQEALERPVQLKPHLQNLFRTPAPWEK
jgi:uncharacterized protein (DUF1778 family)